ncbi:hypothetical protein H6F77_20350 [Microcoleus sp. FACHB-831]|uniref:hypothetical protein n=1 Tax=Microcoleus sp. FACHB-831 TaxID=2692827 RepID=UPI0016896236|nr:hypothetical protein [Microcoleus sp. FACHB-831]MBD1923403.1 hypothetical protein [Microcoleus sp. FACHB-831]
MRTSSGKRSRFLNLDVAGESEITRLWRSRFGGKLTGALVHNFTKTDFTSLAQAIALSSFRLTGLGDFLSL